MATVSGKLQRVGAGQTHGLFTKRSLVRVGDRDFRDLLIHELLESVMDVGTEITLTTHRTGWFARNYALSVRTEDRRYRVPLLHYLINCAGWALFWMLIPVLGWVLGPIGFVRDVLAWTRS